jgi:Protein of unknown function (DUF3617)
VTQRPALIDGRSGVPQLSGCSRRALLLPLWHHGSCVLADAGNNDRGSGMKFTERQRIPYWGRIACFVSCLVLLGSVTGSAAGLSLDVTPGLWEISTSGAVSGFPQIPADLLAGMQPEQRLVAQGMVLAIVAQASVPHRLQFCVTPQQVRQGLDLNRVGGHDCRRTIRSSSPAGLDMQVDCGGRNWVRGVVHVRVLDRSTVVGDVDVHEEIEGAGAAIRQSVHGRWLGASCGNVPSFD